MNRTHLIAAALLVLAGCTGIPQVTEGEKLLAEGKTEEGLAVLERAARDNPTSAEARGAYQTAKQAVLETLLGQADKGKALFFIGTKIVRRERYRSGSNIANSAAD